VLHIVFGPDTFSSHEYVRELVASLLPRDSIGDGVIRIEGKTATPTDILDACGQVSLFGAKPVVIVEGLLARFEPPKRSGGRSKTRRRRTLENTEWSDFALRVQAAVATADLILLDGALGATNELLAALRSKDNVRVFPLPGDEDLHTWIVERARKAGARIDDGAVRQLASQSQGDLWYLASELDKLSVYCQGRMITRQSVAELTAGMTTSNIFWLVDAIVEGRVKDAQRLLADMWQSGLSAGYVLTMVERQLRILAQALEVTGSKGEATLRDSEFARLQHFARTRALRQSRGMTHASVRAAFACVLAADRAIKTGTLDERVALDLLINDLLAVGRTDRVNPPPLTCDS